MAVAGPAYQVPSRRQAAARAHVYTTIRICAKPPTSRAHLWVHAGTLSCAGEWLCEPCREYEHVKRAQGVPEVRWAGLAAGWAAVWLASSGNSAAIVHGCHACIFQRTCCSCQPSGALRISMLRYRADFEHHRLDL